jgi:hypothetical protein
VFAAIAFLLAALSAIAAVGRLVRERRRARARQGFGEPIDARSLSRHEGEVVTICGTLVGGDLSSRFRSGLEAIGEAHPDAVSAHADGLYVTAGKEKVPLSGTAQVVLGAREERVREPGGTALVRRVSTGTEVLARGVVARVEEGAYRDGTARFGLAARPDGVWAVRPLTVAITRRDRSPLLLLLLVAIFAGTAWGALRRGSASVAAGPSCAERIFVRLDRNDVFGAEAELASCGDARARAETLWSLGRIDEAASAFLEARAAAPSSPFTLSEIEAVVVSQPREVTDELLQRAQKDWYRGPSDPAQQTIACLADEQRASWHRCLPGANLDLRDVPGNYGDPVAAVTDTYRFTRELPAVKRVWNDPFARNCSLVGCRAGKPASLALMAAIAGDRGRASSAFASLDLLLDEYVRAGGEQQTAYGISPESLLAEDAFAVAAVAAWLAHDDARTEGYLLHAEAHARDTLAQHLALGNDAKRAPTAGDTSKWSAVDVELFRLADQEEPAVFVRRLRDLRYTLPLRLHALLGPRPRLHAAARDWVEGDFVPPCRACGLFDLMEATSRRREAARIVGAKELEEKLADISRRAGEFWMRDASREALWTLELLYRPE